jgi:hypothetical protein
MWLAAVILGWLLSCATNAGWAALSKRVHLNAAAAWIVSALIWIGPFILVGGYSLGYGAPEEAGWFAMGWLVGPPMAETIRLVRARLDASQADS